MRASGSAGRLAGPCVALAASLLAACSVRSPVAEVKDALGRLSSVEVPDAGSARLELERVRFADVVVSMDGERALVLAVVEAEGRARVEGSRPTVSYVGREAFAMERCRGARWCPVGTPLPALRGVVGALAAEPREPGTRIVAWQIRVERGTARVGEDREGRADPPRVHRRVVLSGDRWTLVPEP